MKIRLFAILFLFASTYLQAQKQDFKHFEVTVSVNFWTPLALHFKASDIVTQYAYPDGSYVSEGALTGYGTSIAPSINLKYYFTKNIGLSLGFCMIHMDKELKVIKTDSTQSNYENIAEIPHITLGVTGKFFPSELLEVFYETGIDFVPGYGLEMQYSSESTDPPDLNADDSAIGVYGKTGVAIKIFNSVFFNTDLTYSYIPVDIEYANTERSVKKNLSTNLGGISLETGISVHF